jgi:hypothetical protein
MSEYFEHAFLSLPLAGIVVLAAAIPLSFALRRQRYVVTTITGLAVSVPWLTGLVVKLWLMHQGQPTWPFVWFVQALPMLVPVALLLALPLILFGVLARRVLLPQPCLALHGDAARGWFVAGVVIGTLIDMVLVFTEIFWLFDPIVFLAMPSIWLAYLPGAVAGAIVGWLLGQAASSPFSPA